MYIQVQKVNQTLWLFADQVFRELRIYVCDFGNIGFPDMIYLFLIMGKMLNRDFSSYFDKKYTF